MQVERPAARPPERGATRPLGLPALSPGRRRVWRSLVPVVCLVAGVGFAASARESNGTELRAPGIANLAGTVEAAESQVRTANKQVDQLQHRVNTAERRAGVGDSAVARAQRRVTPLRAPGGLTAVHGAGLTVVLDDAIESPGDSDGSGGDDAGVDPNQLVVHQSDLQAVVNALWAGGAEAMTIAGQRVIATSAVRCVGNTLLLNGEVFSPPYRVAAIGPSATMQQRLDDSPGVHRFQEAAGYYGLGYTVEPESRVDVPAYSGPLTLIYARAGK